MAFKPSKKQTTNIPLYGNSPNLTPMNRDIDMVLEPCQSGCPILGNTVLF